jgi:hypothetical protein
MSLLRWSVTASTLALLAGACASAEPPGSGGGPDARRIDARLPDGSLPTDGSVTDGPVTDARPTDARPVDAMVPVDAPGGCTTMVLQLLNNPSFDVSPLGSGWSQTVIDPDYPPITADAPTSFVKDSAPNHVWMGGFYDADDEIRQDIAIPIGTTQLLLRGKYQVLTDELAGGGVYDDSSVVLTNQANAVLDTALATDNEHATAAWTPFQRIFAQPYAGQTVRVRLHSHNDDSFVTSFFYDTLALQATVCQ